MVIDKAIVLEKIKEMTARQVKPRPVGIDTLALALKIQDQDLKPFLLALEQEGLVAVHINESKSRRMQRSGTVEFTQLQ